MVNTAYPGWQPQQPTQPGAPAAQWQAAAPAPAPAPAPVSGAVPWDSDLDDSEEAEFILLPAGEYPFTVDHYEPTFYNGGEKIGPCDCADLHINIYTPDGRMAKIRSRFFLWSTMLWKIKQVHTCLGLRKKGHACKMAWDAMPGRTGRCKITIRKSDKGNEYNEVTEWLEPAPGGAPATPVPAANIPGFTTTSAPSPWAKQ